MICRFRYGAAAAVFIFALCMACRPGNPASGRYHAVDMKIDSVKKLIESDGDNLDLYTDLYRFYKLNNRSDSLYWHAFRAYRKGLAEKDYDLAAYSISYMVPVFIESGVKDSAAYYIGLADRMPLKSDKAKGALLNCKANYYLTYEMDYPKVMAFTMEAAESYAACKDTINYALMQHNMATIYLFRNDTANCLRYTLRGHRLASATEDSYLKCISSFAAGQVYYTMQKYDSSLVYLSMAKHAADDYSYLESEMPDIMLIEAYDYLALKDYERAAGSLDSASYWLEMTGGRDVYAASRIRIGYGDLSFDKGDYQSSCRHYLSAARLPLARDGRRILLQRLSMAYKALEEYDSSLYYYQAYNRMMDSVMTFDAEKEFNEIFWNKEKEKYESDLDLSVLKSKRAIALISFVSCVVVAVLAWLYYASRRKNRKYTELVLKYQQDMKEWESRRKDAAAQNDTRAKAEEELFGRIEELFVKGKMYRHNDISLDKLSEALSSNRTYVSAVINKYAGMSFTSYVNMLRIKDATEILSDPGKEPFMKALYMGLGYNSKSSFYKAFQKETGCTPTIYREKAITLGEKSSGQA